MTLLQLLLNILWLVTGGVWMAFFWLVAALIMAITIIGIPWAKAALNIAAYSLLPFGHKAVSRREWTGARGYRHRAFGHARQSSLARSRRLVARLGASSHRFGLGRHHHRHSLRLGAFEARGNRPLADRQDDRAKRCRFALWQRAPLRARKARLPGCRNSATLIRQSVGRSRFRTEKATARLALGVPLKP